MLLSDIETYHLIFSGRVCDPLKRIKIMYFLTIKSNYQKLVDFENQFQMIYGQQALSQLKVLGQNPE